VCEECGMMLNEPVLVAPRVKRSKDGRLVSNFGPGIRGRTPTTLPIRPWYDLSNLKERNRAETERAVEKIVRGHYLPQEVAEEAMLLYDLLVDKGLWPGRNADVYRVALVRVAMRRKNYGIPSKDFFAHFSPNATKQLEEEYVIKGNQAFRDLVERLARAGVKVPPGNMDVRNFITFAVAQLVNTPSAGLKETDALLIESKAFEINENLNGRMEDANPKTRAAAVVYTSALLLGYISVTPTDVGKKLNVAGQTVNELANTIFAELGVFPVTKLPPRCFMCGADAKKTGKKVFTEGRLKIICRCGVHYLRL